MSKYWKIYTDWLEKKLPQYHKLLNPGASSQEIEEVEKALGVEMPNDFKELYQINNGDHLSSNDALFLGAFLGFEFLSLNRILEIHTEWKEFTNDNHWGTSYPEETIKIQYVNPGWIPLFADSASNYIGIDFDPDSKGTVGQIINFGRDEDQKFVVAQNLEGFLAFVAQQIQSGACDKAIFQEDDGGYSYGLTPQSHLIDDLKSICKK